jgi:hypothetical protein
MVPSLICYDFFYGQTPAASGAGHLANFCSQLANAGWNPQNVWFNLGASFAANGQFATSYGTMTDKHFVDAAYQAVFGTAPSSLAETTFINALAPYASVAGSTLGGRGGDVGLMLYLASTTPSSTYAQAVSHFLQDAANETPAYQLPLIGTYLASSTPHLS